MVALDIKQQNSDTVPSLKLSKKEKKPLLSFASLLNTVKVKDEPLKSSNKSDFLSLLGKKPDEALNPQLTASMSSIEIKQLMHQAKKYIKSQIYSSDAFKKHEIASLPKSLKGLIQVAKKIGIDISKITLEKVQEFTKDLKKPISKKLLTAQNIQEMPMLKPEQKNRISTQELVKTKRRVPSVQTVSPKNLEALLKTPKSKSKNEVTDSKPEVMFAPKAESFEVKIHEAKQMVKYLSHDVKNAIEDYKSPFSRIKVQLNPQKLGEVDLTIVQRGKNLHINLSSNNTAINTLAMNANDLKMQLNNSGINNASLNFSNNSQGGAFANSGQQQQQQQRQNAQNEYNYIEHEEKNEEILNSLEIVVPNYA